MRVTRGFAHADATRMTAKLTHARRAEIRATGHIGIGGRHQDRARAHACCLTDQSRAPVHYLPRKLETAECRPGRRQIGDRNTRMSCDAHDGRASYADAPEIGRASWRKRVCGEGG